MVWIEWKVNKIWYYHFEIWCLDIIWANLWRHVGTLWPGYRGVPRHRFYCIFIQFLHVFFMQVLCSFVHTVHFHTFSHWLTTWRGNSTSTYKSVFTCTLYIILSYYIPGLLLLELCWWIEPRQFRHLLMAADVFYCDVWRLGGCHIQIQVNKDLYVEVEFPRQVVNQWENVWKCTVWKKLRWKKARCGYLGNTPCVLLMRGESTPNSLPGSIDVDAGAER